MKNRERIKPEIGQSNNNSDSKNEGRLEVGNGEKNAEEKEGERITEIIKTVNQEIENIKEIIDGGWDTFAKEVDSRNEIFECLANLRDILQKLSGADIKPQRFEYFLLKDEGKYKESLGQNLEKIAALIEEIDLKPPVKKILKTEIDKAISAFNLLEK